MCGGRKCFCFIKKTVPEQSQGYSTFNTEVNTGVRKRSKKEYKGHVKTSFHFNEFCIIMYIF